MAVFQVRGNVNYSIDVNIEAATMKEAQRAFEDYVALEEIRNGNFLREDFEVDDVVETTEEAEYSADA